MPEHDHYFWTVLMVWNGVGISVFWTFMGWFWGRRWIHRNDPSIGTCPWMGELKEHGEEELR